jgi:poly(hydroxyalkanoate) depolymerase family esterase
LKARLRPAPQVPTPDGAQFLARAYAGPTGSREYKLFVPSDVKSRTKGRGIPLILMLHGCAQDPDDFALGTGMNELAETRGCLVAYPKQPTSSNNMACWNWFNLKDQARDSGEPGILAGITRAILAEFKVDEDRVYVAGLSAGGAMAAILAATYPDIFDGAGIHSGLPYGAASDVGSAFNSMRNGASVETASARSNVRTIVFHGDADRTVHPSNGELIVAAARAGLKAPVENTKRGRSSGGIDYARTVIADKRGAPQIEYWSLEGMGHAWSGGRPGGSYTNPRGPDASQEMLRFFLD